MKKTAGIFITFFMCLSALTGCGNVSMYGTWNEYKQVESDGTVTEADDIRITETFVIDGNGAVNTLHDKEGAMKDITVNYTVVKKNEAEFTLKNQDNKVYAEVKIEGDMLSYRIERADEDGDGNPDYTEYYFKKRK